MSNHKDRLADYIEVPDRIKSFKEQFPDGSLQGEWEVREMVKGEQPATFIVYVAKAYRTPLDHKPGVGTAWEPFPGKTPYTRDSELMNAETSAWGRALAALGFIGKKIASKEEVVARQQPNGKPRDTISKKDAESLRAAVKASGVDVNEVQIKLAALGVSKLDELSPGQADELFAWMQDVEVKA